MRALYLNNMANQVLTTPNTPDTQEGSKESEAWFEGQRKGDSLLPKNYKQWLA